MYRKSTVTKSRRGMSEEETQGSPQETAGAHGHWSKQQAVASLQIYTQVVATSRSNSRGRYRGSEGNSPEIYIY